MKSALTLIAGGGGKDRVTFFVVVFMTFPKTSV